MLVLLAPGHDPVARAAAVTACVLLHQVADVDDEAVFDNGHGDPIGNGRVPDLEALGPGLLEEDGYGAEVCVGGH